MADIFISYESSDRPRARVLRTWFEQLGWSVWMDDDIEASRDWEGAIKKELEAARVVVVLWGAQAMRSGWVNREASIARQDGRLVQIHATGLRLPSEFESIQAIRMQAWSIEVEHSEKTRLLTVVAKRLEAGPVVLRRIDAMATVLPPVNYDVVGTMEIAFYYCARQLESRLRMLSLEWNDEDLTKLRETFDCLNERLRSDGVAEPDDREGILHRMLNDFFEQLDGLAPLP